MWHNVYNSHHFFKKQEKQKEKYIFYILKKTIIDE